MNFTIDMSRFLVSLEERMRKSTKKESKVNKEEVKTDEYSNPLRLEQKNVKNYVIRLRYSAKQDAYYLNDDLETPFASGKLYTYVTFLFPIRIWHHYASKISILQKDRT